MFIQIWNKYLPIIRIFLKRSLNGDHSLPLNSTDFERAGATRKSGYKFNIEFSLGRVNNIISSSPIAKDLVTVLLQDPVAKELLVQNDYHITMNSKYLLSFKMIPRAEEASPGKELISETTK